MMKKIRFLIQMLLITACSLVGMEATAQLVDRTTFERHLSRAQTASGNRMLARRATSSSGITLTDNPFILNDFSLNPSETTTVTVYFNTAVMAAYRTEQCPRIAQFNVQFPEGITPTSVTMGSDLGSPLTVTGYFDTDDRVLSVLEYGLCDANEMATFPTGTIAFANITVSAESNLTLWSQFTLTMNGCQFFLADNPDEFFISGNFTTTVNIGTQATNISLNRTSATMNCNETLQLTATILPNNASNKAVTWTSSNTNVATVSSSGLVTAKAAGTATITATTQDGSNLSATCHITVSPQLATGITLNKTSATINNGNALQLTATVTPSNTTNPAVAWASSNTSVATVNNNGMVLAKGPGNVTITATTTDGSNLSASCAVTVIQLATGITLSQTSATLSNGEMLQLTATVMPNNASNKAVTWTSSNTSVATVSSNGLVTAKGRGTATITATTTDGSNLSASCTITVDQLATGISLSQTTANINKGETLQLTATVTPSNANNKTVTWTSSNTTIATVSNTGLVTAKAVGNATITATTADGSSLSASCQVTVNQPATGISINKTSATINNGETLQLTATVSPSNASNKSVTWTSSNTSVATVNSNGLVTAKGRGSATITATTTDGTNLSASCAITVCQLATGISMSQTTASIVVDKTLQLTATVSPSNANNTAVSWTSSNTTIATVSSTGLVTAKAVGNATITATTADGSNLSASCQVTVTPQLATSITLNKTSATLNNGETVQLSATVTPSNASNKSVTWTSSNASVATVNSNGLVTAKGRGTASITATTADGSNLSASCAITVNQLATGITLNKTTASVVVDKTLQLTATVSPSNANNNAVTWTSSNTNIATVSSSGLVTTKAVGNVTITATTADGSNLSASCAVTVTPQLATGISLNKSSATLNNGETLQLTATVTPSNASNKSVTWTSSNASVATVNSNGLVTAKGRGTASITATTADGSNLSASCAITVNQLATGITLNKTTAALNNGETLQLTATVAPSNANNNAVTWTSSNTNVATVSNNGLVTAKGRGTATITATTTDGTNLSASCAITVSQLATGISMSQTTASIVVDKTLQLTATVSPSNANNKAVTWSSSNTGIAMVNSDGLVTAKAVGNVTITATTADGTNLSAACAVTVNPQIAESISLNKSSLSLEVGNSANLVATILPENTTDKRVMWTSTDNSIASVAAGTVYGKSIGECIIKATTLDGSNLTAQCLVSVTGPSTINVTSITLSSTEENLTVGNSTVITATVLPENATNKTLAWNTSNSTVATVNENGLIVAVAAGEANITAASTDGTNITATCHVTVTNNTANNYITADDIEEVVAGQEFVIPVALINADPITAIQTELYLPSGIVPNYNEDDVFVTLEPSRKGRGHTVSTTITALATRIMVSSSRNAAFQGNEGTVMYIYLKANEGLTAGMYGIDLKNIILSTTSGEMIEAPNVKINVGVAAYHSGDANGDGYIDDADYVITASYIMANNPSNFIFNAADMSGDGRVYVNDLPLIIDAAMAFDFGDSSQAPNHSLATAAASVNNSLYVDDFNVSANETKTLSLKLDNVNSFSAVQCDINLPQGMTIVEQTDEWGDPTYAVLVSTRSNDHDAWTDITGRGDVRVIITNSNNKNIKGGSGALAKFKVKANANFSGEHELVIKNIVCVDANVVRYALPNAVCLINHVSSLQGDVDGNGHVDGTDLNILINIILGKDNAANYDGRANVDGNGGVDGTDLNTLINIILGK